MEEKEGGESSTIEAHPSGAEHLGVPACLQKKVNPCQVPEGSLLPLLDLITWDNIEFWEQFLLGFYFYREGGGTRGEGMRGEGGVGDG